MHGSEEQGTNHLKQKRKKGNRSIGKDSWRHTCQRWKGACCQWKVKGQCTRETLAVSATMRTSVESNTVVHFCLESTDAKRRGGSFKESLRGRSPSGKRSGRPCKNDIRGNCTNPWCNLRYPPECQHYKTHSGSILVKSAHSGTMRLTLSLTRSRRKVAVKVLLLDWKIRSKRWVA